MSKAYWISAYRLIHDEAAVTAYAKLAGPPPATSAGPANLA